jgi:hypothetical protein
MLKIRAQKIVYMQFNQDQFHKPITFNELFYKHNFIYVRFTILIISF